MVLEMEIPKKLEKKKERLKWYLTGFADAEGCFSIAIEKQDTARFGWVIDPLFQVTQHQDTKGILYLFRNTMNCGRVIKKPGKNDLYIFIVDNRRQLAEKVMPFFDRYPLITKRNDFEYFKGIVNALERGDHRDLGKFQKLIETAYKMNKEGKQRRRSIKEIFASLKG